MNKTMNTQMENPINKKNLYLLAAIIVVVLILIVQALLKPNGPVELAKWNPDKADKIVIQNRGRETVFEKRDDGIWLAGPEKYIADAEMMNGLLNRMSNAKILQKVTSKEDYSRYGLDEADEGVITVYQKGKRLFQLTVGQEDSSTRFSYIRLPDEKGVYLVSRNLHEQIGYDINHYREMDILNLESGSIERIKVSIGADYELVKVAENGESSDDFTEVWKVQGNNTLKLNQQVANNLAKSLEIVQAVSFVDEITTEEVWKIEITQKDGAKSQIDIYAPAGEDEDKYEAASTGSPYKAVLQTYESKSVMKKLDELLEK